MDLKKEGVSNILLKSLCILQKNSLFKDYYLVGGTALSLHIGHRISEDIDLFTNSKLKKEEILSFIKSNISDDIKITNSEEKILQLYSDNKKLKIDFVELPYKLINPLIKKDGICLVGMDDLAAMKVSATGTRGNEAKDFVDLYYILKYMSIEKIFDNFKKKYETNDILHYVRSAMYFDDIKEDSWKSIKIMYDKDISKHIIMNTLTNEIKKYQESELLKINNINTGNSGEVFTES